MSDADVVVVGAGAAGCVAAARLLQRGAGSVLLVEAGGPVRDLRSQVPLAFLPLLRSAEVVAPVLTAPGPPGFGSEPWLRGRGLGGTTAINGMLHLRGSAEAHDAMAAAGLHGWSWSAMRPIYDALEQVLQVSRPMPVDPLTDAMFAAAAASGIDAVADVCAADGERIGPVPSTIRGGRRVSAADAFLRPARRRGLRVMTGATAERLLLDGTRVRGVRLVGRQGIVDVHTDGAVVLAAGTIGSALLLQRSGLGPPQVLRRAGIDVVVAHPRLGEGVVEHRAVTLKAGVRDGLGHNRALGSHRGRLRALIAYLCDRGRSRLARGPFDLVAMVRAASTGPADALLLLTGLCLDETGTAPAAFDGLTIQGYGLRPTSRGSIHLSGAGLADPPALTMRHLEEAADRAVAAGVLARARTLIAAPPLRDLVTAEVAPGPDVTRIDDIVRYVRRSGAGIYHAVGSCAMGADDDAVVDAALRVRGVDGVRVADASVLPWMVSGASAAPAMAVGWRVADLLVAAGSSPGAG